MLLLTDQGSAENHTPLGLHCLLDDSRVYGGNGDIVAELAKGSCQSAGAALANLGFRLAALLDISHPLMQDLPNHAAEAMGDCPDGRLVTQARQQTPEHRLKVTPLLLHRSVR